MCFHSRPPPRPRPQGSQTLSRPYTVGCGLKEGGILQGPECHPFLWPVCLALLTGIEGEQARPRGREMLKRTPPLPLLVAAQGLEKVFQPRARVKVNPDVKVYPKKGAWACSW